MASLRAYTPLGALSLPSSSYLHPDACNPAMDVVALLSRAPSTRTVEGKGHAVTLWRSNSGLRVWTKKIDGWVEGLGWSPDGNRLALYVRDVEDVDKTTLKIYSIHDGEHLQSTEAPCLGAQSRSVKGKGREDLAEGRVKIEWSWTAEPGPALFGSGLSVIASSLPYLQPHEIPPPAPAAHSFIPFARFGAAALQTRSSEPAYLKPQLPRLAHAVLPPLPLEAPRASLLTLTLAHPDKPSRSHPFLSGTFPLPSLPAPLPLGDLIARPPSKETHAFTETVTALDDLLRYLAVGIDNLREAWAGKHGGSAATRDWVSAIGEALRQHGEDDDVKRALSGLLMTGMSGHGLMHILGGKLTPRTLGRWESTVLGSLTTIRQTTSSDLIPAAERVLLLLRDLHGWALWPERLASHLHLSEGELEQAISITTLLVHELITLEQQARDEHHRFSQFSLWLAYEVATAAANASQDSDDDPLLDGKHNVLLVADFIHAGLLQSDLDRFFASESSPSTQLPLPTAQSLRHSLGSTKLDSLLARLAETVARPASAANTARHPPDHDASFATSVQSQLKSPVLNRSHLRFPSPAKPAPPQMAAKRSRPPRDEFDAMDESSVDMSMSISMSMDQTTSDGDHGAAPPSPSEINTSIAIDPAPGAKDEVALPSVTRRPLAPSLPALAEGLVGIIRRIVMSALLPSETSEGTIDLDLRKVSDLSRTRRAAGEPTQLAIVVKDNGASAPALWLIRRPAPDRLEYAAFALHIKLSDTTESEQVEMVDLGYFTADELVVLLSVGPYEDARIMLASVDLSAVGWRNGPSPLVPNAVEALLQGSRPNSLPALPLQRIRHITALDRLPRPDPSSATMLAADPHLPLPLASLALNGHPNRMTGSVLSWSGRELVVFDLAEDEGDDDEDDESGEMEE